MYWLHVPRRSHCASAVDFDGYTYLLDPRHQSEDRGARIGTGHKSACGPRANEPVPIFRIRGVDPDQMVISPGIFGGHGVLVRWRPTDLAGHR